MKKILLVLTCIVAMAMMIVGCGGSDKKDAAKGNDKKITVGFSVSTQNNPFFVSLAKGVEAKAKELGVTVKVVDAQNDPAKQANDIADLLQQNISVLLVNPVDSDAISTSVKAANKAALAGLKKLPGKVLVAINQKLGFRFITKFGQKGIINLGKGIPCVGGILNGGINLAETRHIAKDAVKAFLTPATIDYIH